MENFFDKVLKSIHNQPLPRKGDLLLSEPFMDSEHFNRSVVLLVDHDESGSLGFMLNREVVIALHDVIENFPNFHDPVYLGGPVEMNSLHFIHKLGPHIEGAIEFFPNIYWGGNFDQIKNAIITGEATNENIKFFCGYSGWSEDQLKTEIENNTWILYQPKDLDWLFTRDPDALWYELLKEKGGPYAQIANIPEDPSAN